MRSVTSFAPKLPAGIGGPAGAPALPAAIPAQAARPGVATAVPAAYAVAAILLTWRLWADPASRMVAGNPHDADLFAWFLRYAASAVRHGHLPALVTTGMNAPIGVNLMWNTPMLLPGILLSPVTLLFGPQASLTILTTAGFAGSALALYWVLRRWSVSTGAAALAGAVYGFSPAMVQEAAGHYNLELVILPPLILDAGLRLAIGHRTGEPDRAGPGGLARLPWLAWLGRVPAPVRAGTWLGLLGAAQIFSSEEIALATAIAGLAAVLTLALSHPAGCARRVLPAVAGALWTVLVTLALAGHALAVQFHGPLTQHGAVYPLDYYVNDVTSFVTPQASLLFHTAASAAAAARYQGGAAEYLAYLGWPLLALLVLAAVVSWRHPAGRAAAATFAILAVLSLGGYLLLGGTTHHGIELPWHWIEELPVVSTALPDRLSVLADGAAAVLLAIGMDEATARLGGRRARSGGETAPDGHQAAGIRPAVGTTAAATPMDAPAAVGPAAVGPATVGRPTVGTPAVGPPTVSPPAVSQPAVTRPAGLRSAGSRRGFRWLVLTVAVLGCLPLLPRPLPAASTDPLPAGWSAVFAGLRLAPGTRVLVVPVPLNFLTPVLRWSADSGDPATMIGGYFIGPGAANGQPYIDGTGTRPTGWYLDGLWAAGLSPASPYASDARMAGLAVGPAGGPSLPASPTPAQLSADLRSWRPGAVVADAAPGSPLDAYLDQLFGPASVTSHGLTGWRLAGS